MHLEVGTHHTGIRSDWEKVSVNGGAIALGHPVDWTGARITVTLLYIMMKRDADWGWPPPVWEADNGER